MGSYRKEGGVFDRDNDNTEARQSIKEIYLMMPYTKSCSVTMEFADIACKSIKQSVMQRKLIHHDVIIKIMHYSFVHKLEHEMQKLKMDINAYEDVAKFVANTPSLSGGLTYNSNCKQLAEKATFEFDVIHISIGLRYKGYYTHFVRSLLINPTIQIQNNYKFLESIQKVITFTLRDGVELSRVYRAGLAFAQNENAHLTHHLHKRFGFQLNARHYIPRDKLNIYSDSTGIAKYGMTYAITLGLSGLLENGKRYSLCITDTVFVKKNVRAQVLTQLQRDRFETVINNNNV